MFRCSIPAQSRSEPDGYLLSGAVKNALGRLRFAPLNLPRRSTTR